MTQVGRSVGRSVGPTWYKFLLREKRKTEKHEDGLKGITDGPLRTFDGLRFVYTC